MSWWMTAVIIGAVVAPWVVMGPTLKMAFLRGLQAGLGAWFGIALGTTPIIVAIMWIGSLFI
jgi:hypothetical protein